MSLSKITRHGQITIPKTIREELNLEEGDYVEVIRGEEGILLRPKKVKLIDPDEWEQQRMDDSINTGRPSTQSIG